MSANITSNSADLSFIDGFAIYAKWTGSPAGTLKLQASLDDINYVDIANSEQTISGPSDFMWNVSQVFYDKIRVIFTRSGGTGILNVQINGKGTEDF